MAKEIIMPKFGFTQEESEILEWLHTDGEKVEKGDPIAVVSTDKISMEVEAPETGILSGIKYKVGDIVPVTEIIAYILQPGESIPEEKRTQKKKEVKPTKAVESREILVTPLAKKLIEKNALDISLIKGTGEKGKITKTDVQDFLLKKVRTASSKVRATPAARRTGREKNIDLIGIRGSGPGGRIQAADVLTAAASFVESKAENLTISNTIPLIGMRRTIAQNMKKSWSEIPHMTLQIDIPVDEIEFLRGEMNASINEKRQRISLTAFITKATSEALSRNPIVNSQYSEKEIKIIKEVHIGIATALADGLIVPVIHYADRKSVKQISAEIKDLTQRAQESKLKPEDLVGATFTISNLGMYEIDRFTAIINPPQAAILAVGKKTRKFIPTEENLPIVQSIVTFTICADHRVMDGAQAAKFMADLKKIILKPKALIE
ncbi:MAG: 2-oxo acid dehydrogenase subunit E2 [Anaerolineaceae bacterium]|nr:2-oxo acid dehydrogenase subunit E2 [Anaerolineaceae bacterium]